LKLAGKDFEDVRVKFPEWAELKPKTPYGQLPLMEIDGGAPRTQSMAMLRYVGATFSETLYPREKLLDIEESIGLVEDFLREWRVSYILISFIRHQYSLHRDLHLLTLFIFRSFQSNLYIAMRPEVFGYPEGFGKTPEGQELCKTMRTKFVEEKLPVFLGHFQDMIEKHGGAWLASKDAPTIADCLAVVNLRQFKKGHLDHVPTTCLDTHPKVVDYLERFCALEPIKGRYDVTK
jgi:glutathione S-transferase